MNRFAHRREGLIRLALCCTTPWLGSVPGPSLAAPLADLSPSGPAAELASIWHRDGGVLLVRHAQTESGLGDPPGFALGQCSTQRNLSEAGRQASLSMGRWMRAKHFKPDAVRSSQWCRCQDTAQLAFGLFEAWPALNSTFAGQGDAGTQQKALRDRLSLMSPGRKEVWVTHQVVMTDLTGAYPAMGEAFLVSPQARLLARGFLN